MMFRIFVPRRNVHFRGWNLQVPFANGELPVLCRLPQNSLQSALEQAGKTPWGHTVLEHVLDEISYSATDRSGETVAIDAAYVQKHVGDLAKNADLSKFIL